MLNIKADFDCAIESFIYYNARGGYFETWKHTWEIEYNKDQFEIIVSFVCRKYIYFLSVFF